MDSEILDQLTNLGRDVDSEFPKPKRGRNSSRLWHGSRGVILKNRKNLNKLLVFEALYL